MSLKKKNIQSDSENIKKAERPTELNRFTRLVGEWKLIGRTLNAQEDDIFGKTNIHWILNGFYLESKGEIEIKSSNFKLTGIEIMGYDPVQKVFPSVSFSNLNSTPAYYYWNIVDDVVTHWTKGAKYTGTFSNEYKILTGGWKADDGVKITPGNTYDATMIKIN